MVAGVMLTSPKKPLGTANSRFHCTLKTAMMRLWALLLLLAMAGCARPRCGPQVTRMTWADGSVSTWTVTVCDATR
jgi:hypothetical protein